MLAAYAFRAFVEIGHLTIIDAHGVQHEFEGKPGPRAVIRLTDAALHHRLFFSPHLAVGEGYMDGGLLMEEGTTLYDFLDLCMANVARTETASLQWLFRYVRALRAAWRHWNPVGAARRKVSHHYDLNDTLFDLFLDRDRQYSCGYFHDPTDDIDTAQLNKKRHLAAKLLVEPGHKVLDIGSGWGGLGLFLAGMHDDVTVDGVTLSHEQHRVSNERAAKAGLADRVHFHLRDYRELDAATYDRIVSVGMLEHVGPRHYEAYYRQVKRLLAPDGVAVIHSIGVFCEPYPLNPWMEKYIFPGPYTPALSQQMTVIERTGLYTTDIEVLRAHYAETLKAWRLACERHRDRIVELYDERFYRMWTFYLTGCEIAFRRGNLMVFQIQLAKSLDTVPQTRDYIAEFEGNLRAKARQKKRPKLHQVGD